MKVVIINKSDSLGGAAVVSRRLLFALRDLGVDAQMLVVDKQTDSPYIHIAARRSAIQRAFLSERLKIFLANGLNRETLFKIDTASDGLPLHKHPLVREADVICLNWVNQGMLSMHGVRELVRLGKPVVWTMHDMWNFTGICHHAGACRRWETNCGLCPLLGKGASPDDLSFKVWNNKNLVYPLPPGIHFVAVSNWLGKLAGESSLLRNAPLSIIPNAFPIPADNKPRGESMSGRFTIVMGAARLDDPVKGLPILVRATEVLRSKYPDEAAHMRLVTFGGVKDKTALEGIAIEHEHLGMVRGEDNVRRVYEQGDVVVSTSLYETLPGTLVEGQVYGCVPVTFGRGGQRDIVDHLVTGYVAEWSDDQEVAAEGIAEGIIWAMRQPAALLRDRMLASARARFSAPAVATRYLELFKRLAK